MHVLHDLRGVPPFCVVNVGYKDGIGGFNAALEGEPVEGDVSAKGFFAAG